MTRQTDRNSLTEECINYLFASPLSSSLCASLLTLCNLFCLLYTQETYVPAPQYVVGSGGEGGGVTAGNERQIHQNKEVGSSRERGRRREGPAERFIEDVKENC